ncbi:MAG: hypothetical protein H7222_15425 [Methylotenera sp.]|nr:hypothetical protein [Oligoflexia bacterium]
MKLNLAATGVILNFLISSVVLAGPTVPSATPAPQSVESLDTMSEDAVSALDNMPTACTGLPVMHNGATLEDTLKKDAAWCEKNHCKESFARMKSDESREILAKTSQQVRAKVLQGDPETLRRRIDGPANIRDAPDGSIIGSFPNRFIVLLTAQKGDWYQIQGYWERACETGWTHKKNLLPVSRAQLDSEFAAPFLESEALKEAWHKAFKAYFTQPASAKMAIELAQQGIDRASRCSKAQPSRECTTAVHFLNLLQARIALDQGDLTKADHYLIASAKIPADDAFNALGPNTVIAKALLDRGHKAAVIEFLELTKKFWLKTPVRHGSEAFYTVEDHRCELPATWIAQIRAGKSPKMDEIKNYDAIWTQDYWK